MKYVIYLDYLAGTKNPGWEYVKTAAKDVCEAIELSEGIWRNHDDLYLIRVMEKDGANYKIDGMTVTTYKAIMCKRSDRGGWHRNIEKNFENHHVAGWFRCKSGADWFDVVR